MRKSLQLLEQIIEAAENQDAEFKKNNASTKGSRTVGESWMVYHLKLLEELLEEEEKKRES